MWKHEPCNAPLMIEYTQKVRFRRLKNRKWNMWRYKEALPLKRNYRKLPHAGGTPLISQKIYGVNVLLKLEYLNLSGSFKDRGAALTVIKALEFNIKRISVDSSGNSGIAFTLYARSVGIEPWIYVPADAPSGKKRLLMALGAKLFEIPGSREDVFKEALKSSLDHNVSYAGHLWSPYFIEGVKTFVFELLEELKWKAPTALILPSGSGSLLVSSYKGLRELQSMGLIDTMPKLISVQAVGYESVCKKSAIAKSKLADGLKVINPPRILEMKHAIEETSGTCIVVDDNEIKDSLKKLWSMGLVIEPTSAAAFAAFKKAIKNGIIKRGDSVAIPLTGSGLKMIDYVSDIILS